MKKIILLLCLISTSAFASDCGSLLLEKVNKDPNIRIVKMLDSYSCGQTMCAVIFEHDNRPYENAKVLAYLDTKHGLNVNWVPFNGTSANGHEKFDRSKNIYVDASLENNKNLTVHVTVETPRDALFRIFYRTTYNETLNCTQL